MTKAKSLKRVLLFSVISILICFAMLIGTTFAWFTDTASNTGNRIVSGKLKVGLDYYNLGSDPTATVPTADGTPLSEVGWQDVNESDDGIFPEALYEPGYTQVTYFRVRNAGNLALKYQLALLKTLEIAGTNVAGESFLLSDYLVFKFVDLGTDVSNTLTYVTREEAQRAALDDPQAIPGAAGDYPLGFTNPYVVNSLEVGDDVAHYYALVVFMPTTVGNEANYKLGTVPPELDFDIKLVATQFSSERDAFDQYYDEKAYNEDWNVYQCLTGMVNNGKGLSAYNDEGTAVVTVTSENVADEVTLYLSECNSPVGIPIAAGSTYKSYDISIKNAAGETPEGTYTVTVYAGTQIASDIRLYHNGELAYDGTTAFAPVSNVSYDADTGYLTFDTDTFSAYTVAVTGAVASIKETGAVYATVQEAFNALEDGVAATVVLQAKEISGEFISAAESRTLTVSAGKIATLDLNGCALKGSSTSLLTNRGELTIKDSSPKGSGIVATEESVFELDSNTQISSMIVSRNKLTIESGKFVANSKSFNNVINVTGGEFYMTDGTITGYSDSAYVSYLIHTSSANVTKFVIEGGRLFAEAKGQHAKCIVFEAAAEDADIRISNVELIANGKGGSTYATVIQNDSNATVNVLEGTKILIPKLHQGQAIWNTSGSVNVCGTADDPVEISIQSSSNDAWLINAAGGSSLKVENAVLTGSSSNNVLKGITARVNQLTVKDTSIEITAENPDGIIVGAECTEASEITGTKIDVTNRIYDTFSGISNKGAHLTVSDTTVSLNKGKPRGIYNGANSVIDSIENVVINTSVNTSNAQSYGILNKGTVSDIDVLTINGKSGNTSGAKVYGISNDGIMTGIKGLVLTAENTKDGNSSQVYGIYNTNTISGTVYGSIDVTNTKGSANPSVVGIRNKGTINITTGEDVLVVKAASGLTGYNNNTRPVGVYADSNSTTVINGSISIDVNNGGNTNDSDSIRFISGASVAINETVYTASVKGDFTNP